MSFSVLNITVKEKELFLDFQGGNHAVFDYFFDKYDQGLCVYDYRMLKSNSEAEDLVRDFNNGTTWNIGLNRLGNGLENQPLKMDIFSLSSQPRVYFDDESAKQEGTVAKVKKIRLMPEYQFNFNINGNGLKPVNQ